MEESESGEWAEEERCVANAKKTFLLAAGAAVQKFREKLADEQEIVGSLANIVMEVYGMESCCAAPKKPRAPAAIPPR